MLLNNVTQNLGPKFDLVKPCLAVRSRFRPIEPNRPKRSERERNQRLGPPKGCKKQSSKKGLPL